MFVYVCLFVSVFLVFFSCRTSPVVMEETFRRIDDMLVKTMIAAESEITPRVFAECNYRYSQLLLYYCTTVQLSSC